MRQSNVNRTTSFPFHKSPKGTRPNPKRMGSRARDKAQVPELQCRYADWEIIGAPEIRHGTPGSVEQFNPFTSTGA